MNLNVNGHNVFLIIFCCFISSVVLVQIMKKVAVHINALDIPNERKVHKEPIPLLGGIGIFLAFLLNFMIFGTHSTLMNSILIASFLILLLGIFDDINPIKASYKFIVQLLIAAVIVFYGNLKLNYIDLFNFSFTLGWLSYPISMLLIVGIINAINLIDGLDGLCAGISSIYFLTIAIIGFILNKFNGLDIMISVLMLGSTLGFLVHNFPPAKIFMGDAGSTFIGLMISIITLIGFKTFTLTSLVIPAWILLIPISDTLFAIIRRKLNHKPIGLPDKEHFHHQLLKLFSKTKTVLIIYGINLIFSAVSIIYAVGYKKEMVFCYIFLLLATLFLVLKTNIIFEHKKK